MTITKIGNVDLSYLLKEVRKENQLCPICGETRTFGDWVKDGCGSKGIAEMPEEYYTNEGFFLKRLYRHTVIDYVKLRFRCMTCGTEWTSEPIELSRYEKEGLL